MKFTLQLLLLSVLISLSLQNILYEWKYLNYDWDSEDQEEYYKETGQYQENASVPIDALITSRGTFLTTIRDVGVPSGINLISSEKDENGSPLIKPYPDWGWTDLDKPCTEVIVSVYRVDIDECDRIWILDTGKNGNTIVCPPKLIVFNLKNDEVILQKEIPDEYAYNANGTGLLVTPLVITEGEKCQNITVYIADIEGHALVAWYGDDKFNRWEEPQFANDPNSSTFNVDGYKFVLDDGVCGLALDKNCSSTSSDILYFSALSSYDMYHVSLNSLETSYNESLQIIADGNDLPYHKTSLAIVHNLMFFFTIEDYSLRQWDVRTEYNSNNTKVIWTSKEELNFVSGFKIFSSDTNCTILYGVSDKYERTATKTRDINETNFIVFEYSFCESDIV